MFIHSHGQERRGHIFPYFAQTVQRVPSHLCWTADDQRGSPKQDQETTVKLLQKVLLFSLV